MAQRTSRSRHRTRRATSARRRPPKADLGATLVRNLLARYPAPKRSTRRPTVEDWERLGYRVTDMGESGRIMEPIAPTPGQRYRALQQTLMARVWRHGIPRPEEYTAWYQEHAPAKLQRASWPENLFCERCDALIRDASGNAVLHPYFTDPKWRPDKKPRRLYCSAACRDRTRVARWRAEHPEHKLKR